VIKQQLKAHEISSLLIPPLNWSFVQLFLKPTVCKNHTTTIKAKATKLRLRFCRVVSLVYLSVFGLDVCTSNANYSPQKQDKKVKMTTTSFYFSAKINS